MLSKKYPTRESNMSSVFDLSLVRKLKLPLMTGLATVYNITASFEEILQIVILYLPMEL